MILVPEPSEWGWDNGELSTHSLVGGAVGGVSFWHIGLMSGQIEEPCRVKRSAPGVNRSRTAAGSGQVSL